MVWAVAISAATCHDPVINGGDEGDTLQADETAAGRNDDLR